MGFILLHRFSPFIPLARKGSGVQIASAPPVISRVFGISENPFLLPVLIIYSTSYIWPSADNDKGRLWFSRPLRFSLIDGVRPSLPFQSGREDAEYCGGGYDFHHYFPEAVGGEVYRAVVGELGFQLLVLEAPAREDAAKHRGERHHDAVGEVSGCVDEVAAADFQAARERYGGGQADEEYQQGHDERRVRALDAVVYEVSGRRFEQRYRRGERREEEEQEEYRGEYHSAGHLREEPRQRDEGEARARFGWRVEGEYGGEYHEPREERHGRVD